MCSYKINLANQSNITIEVLELPRKLSCRKSFLEFVADSAVQNRNRKVIKGKQQIATYFDSQTLQNVSMEWELNFVEVAMAGEPKTASGYFHTVWKYQEDASWKFIYY
jgi:hypothetical protein